LATKIHYEKRQPYQVAVFHFSVWKGEWVRYGTGELRGQ